MTDERDQVEPTRWETGAPVTDPTPEDPSRSRRDPVSLPPPQGHEQERDVDAPAYRPPHDPTGTQMAERIAAAARGVAPVRRRKRPVDTDPDEVPWSGPGPSRRDPQAAGAVLDSILTRRGWKKQVSVVSLMPQWAQFVGDVNAQHTKPEKWESGVLTVRADSTTWATSLRAMSPQIIARLNEILGPRTVTRLQILGPQAPSWKKGPRSVPGRGPRDTYG
ncbi:MAG: DciA family protein [Propionibacteriaceae bacterium]|nr:DciA family protein [Propionibacteriaceae bacterium]